MTETKKFSGSDFLKLLKTIIFDWLDPRSGPDNFFKILPKVLSRAATLFWNKKVGPPDVSQKSLSAYPAFLKSAAGLYKIPPDPAQTLSAGQSPRFVNDITLFRKFVFVWFCIKWWYNLPLTNFKKKSIERFLNYYHICWHWPNYMQKWQQEHLNANSSNPFFSQSVRAISPNFYIQFEGK